MWQAWAASLAEASCTGELCRQSAAGAASGADKLRGQCSRAVSGDGEQGQRAGAPSGGAERGRRAGAPSGGAELRAWAERNLR